MNTVVAMASGLATLAACAGWGRVVAACAGTRVDAGLALSWGLAALLFLGGVATALGVATAPVLAGLLAAGVMAALLSSPWRRWCGAWRKLDWRWRLLAALAVAFSLLRLAAAARFGANEPCDDFLAYQPLVTQLLQAGNLEAPFSLRRLAAYGGQTLLQAFAVLNGDHDAVNLADAALGPVFLLGLGWSLVARVESRPPARALALAFVLLVGMGLMVRTNSGSQVTSLVCFLALVRTLLLILDADRRARLCVVYGLIAAAAYSLRHLNLPFPALLLLAFLPTHVARRGWPAAWRDGGIVLAAWVVFLAPWMAALYASSATPLYPLIKGYHDPAFDFATAAGGWRQVAAMVAGVVLQPQIGASLLLLPAALALPRDRAARPVLAASAVGVVAIMAAFPAAASLHMARYIQPTLVAGLLFAMLDLFARDSLRTPLVRKGLAVCVALGLAHLAQLDVMLLAGHRDPDLPLVYSPALLDERLAAYAEGQLRVPAGAPVFVYVSAPFGFDSARNRILNADEPGPVSPPPGLPFFKGADAVAAYLRGQGIRYVAFEDYDSAVTWCLSPAGIGTIVEPLWQPWKPYLFDLMANLHELGRTRTVLYDAHGVVVVDLGAEESPLRRDVPRAFP